jgi:c-di-GMP-related signal transduction protein
VDSFIARQPIFDRGQQVFGYELLFRSGPENFFTGADTDSASSQVIGESLHGFGLAQLIGPRKAFLNVSRRVLVDGLVQVLPPERTVIEILETVDPDDDVLDACRELKRAGFLIALDDFVDRPEVAVLVDLADIIKIDFKLTPALERAKLAREFRRRGIQLVAEKVETREDFLEGRDAGYTYFQGYFFCRPEMLNRKEIPAVKQSYLRFLREVTRADIDYRKLEPIIRQDVALTVKLLRFLNSAHFGFREPVVSIRHALLLLGERAIRQWASLMALVRLGEGKPPELLTTSLIRARFCESAGQPAGLDHADDDLFLLGLLSTMDALTDQPLEDILADMPLSPEIKHALLGEASRLGSFYALALACERGDWERVSTLCRELTLDETEVGELYLQSVKWADQMSVG